MGPFWTSHTHLPYSSHYITYTEILAECNDVRERALNSLENPKFQGFRNNSVLFGDLEGRLNSSQKILKFLWICLIWFRICPNQMHIPTVNQTGKGFNITAQDRWVIADLWIGQVWYKFGELCFVFAPLKVQSHGLLHFSTLSAICTMSGGLPTVPAWLDTMALLCCAQFLAHCGH